LICLIIQLKGRWKDNCISSVAAGLVGWLVYFCCSHVDHRASVKRFVSPQCLNLRHSVGLPGRVISPSQSRYLTQTQNKYKQASMLRVGFELVISVFERAKTVHASDRAATVIGIDAGLLVLLSFRRQNHFYCRFPEHFF
jgi:hypothetical protein